MELELEESTFLPAPATSPAIHALEPIDDDELEDALEDPELERDTLDEELERESRNLPTKRGSLETPDGERF